jgi:hypothetical protein
MMEMEGRKFGVCSIVRQQVDWGRWRAELDGEEQG